MSNIAQPLNQVIILETMLCGSDLDLNICTKWIILGGDGLS